MSMMDASEGKRLAEFSKAIRESSLRRLRVVPEGYENWRVSPEAMSFADLAEHLVDGDNWLFRMLEGENLDRMVGKPHLVEPKDRGQYLGILDQLARTGVVRAEILEQISEAKLNQVILDPRFGKASAWWVIVRGNLDHEIHHRGQIAVYLRIIGQ